MYKLDYSKAETLQISNDAYYYLKDGEEPIDEDNIEEADEVYEMFPNGFIMQDDVVFVEGTDMVEVTFIPYVQDDDDYDMYDEAAKGFFYQIKFTSEGRSVKLWSYRERTGERVYKGEYELRVSAISKNKGIGFQTGDWKNGKGCLLWLKHFKERKPGTVRITKNLPLGF